METTSKTKEFVLPSKKVIIKPIRNPRGAVKDPNHVSFFMVPGSTIDISAPVDRRTNSIICPLSPEEKKFFEDPTKSGLHYTPGELSPDRDNKSNYWIKTEVKLRNEDLELDLSKPKDYLTYCILRANKNKISPSWNERNNRAEYIFAITEADEVMENKLSETELNLKAYNLYGKMSESEGKLRDFLFSIGLKPSSNHDKKWLQSQVVDYMEKNKQKFIDILEDKYYEESIILRKAVNCGAVQTKNKKFYLPDESPLAHVGEEPSFVNSVNYIANDQELKLTLVSKIEAAK